MSPLVFSHDSLFWAMADLHRVDAGQRLLVADTGASGPAGRS
jgi:hypothetical protein